MIPRRVMRPLPKFLLALSVLGFSGLPFTVLPNGGTLNTPRHRANCNPDRKISRSSRHQTGSAMVRARSATIGPLEIGAEYVNSTRIS